MSAPAYTARLTPEIIESLTGLREWAKLTKDLLDGHLSEDTRLRLQLQIEDVDLLLELAKPEGDHSRHWASSHETAGNVRVLPRRADS